MTQELAWGYGYGNTVSNFMSDHDPRWQLFSAIIQPVIISSGRHVLASCRRFRTDLHPQAYRFEWERITNIYVCAMFIFCPGCKALSIQALVIKLRLHLTVVDVFGAPCPHLSHGEYLCNNVPGPLPPTLHKLNIRLHYAVQCQPFYNNEVLNI